MKIIEEERLKQIEARLNNLPPVPWHFCHGDDFDHWMLWGEDGTAMVQDDSGVPPDDYFIEFVLNAPEDIKYLIKKLRENAHKGNSDK